MKQVSLPLKSLVVSSLNTRKDLRAGEEDSSLKDLAESIRRQGLLSPITVRPIAGEQFEVVAGQRRFLACQAIALDPIPCLLRDDIDDTDAMTISLVENVHRADMHPLDKAQALKALHDRYGSYERVAQETAWSATTVARYIKLLDLPETLRERLSTASGAAGVGAMSRLATTFHGEAALDVYERIAGFTQKIQEEILKRSHGEIDAIDELVFQAQEGAFEARKCGGAFGCEVVRDILAGDLKLTSTSSSRQSRQMWHPKFRPRSSATPLANSGRRWLNHELRQARKEQHFTD